MNFSDPENPTILCPHCKMYQGPVWGYCKKCGKSLMSWKIKGVDLFGFPILFIIMFNFPEGCSGPTTPNE